MVKVMFVCLGNICRSPTVHGVFQSLLDKEGLAQRIYVESSGTGGWHVGEPPDARAQRFALSRGYDLSGLKAQQIQSQDFDRFDYILVMDEQNLTDLRARCPESYRGHLGLFLDYTDMTESEVPDPYYGGDAGFEHVLDLAELSSKGLLSHILAHAQQTPS